MKAQTATEYLVILAVVIVIALIVVGVLGGIPSIGGGVSENAARVQLSNYGALSVDNWAVFRNETIIQVRNIQDSSIQLRSVYVNGTQKELNKTLRPGQKISFSANVSLLSPEKYTFPISYAYEDIKTGAAYVENDSSASIFGISVNEPFFLYAMHSGNPGSMVFNGVSIPNDGSDYTVIDTLSAGSSFSYQSTFGNECVPGADAEGPLDTSISGTCDSISLLNCGDTSPLTVSCTNIQSDVYALFVIQD